MTSLRARMAIGFVLLLGIGLAGCEPRQPPKPKTAVVAVAAVLASSSPVQGAA